MPTPFSTNSIKGRVAETIIQKLFLAHDHNVFHYGMERSIPGITQLTAGKTITLRRNLLLIRKDLDLARKLTVQFGQLAKKFFTGV